MKNTTLAVAIFITLLPSCSFQSNFGVEVAVYDGTDVKPVVQQPSRFEVAEAVVDSIAVCEQAADRLESAAESLKKYEKQLKSVSELISQKAETIPKSAAFKRNAKEIRDGFRKALDSIFSAKPDDKKKLEQEIAKALSESPQIGKMKAKIEGFTIADWVRYDLLKTIDDGEQSKLLSNLLTILGPNDKRFEFSRNKAIEEFLESIKTTPALFKALSDSLGALKIDNLNFVIDTKGVGFNRASTLAATAKNRAERLTESSTKLREDVASLRATQERIAANTDSNSLLSDALRARREITSFGRKLAAEIDALDLSKLKGRLQVLAANDVSALVIQNIFAATASPKQRKFVQELSEGSLRNQASQLHEMLNVAVGDLNSALRLPATVASADGYALAALRSRPFETADPNIRVITSNHAVGHWNAVPLDALKVLGDGEGQYVIVQDGPTNYRIKELHVDPSGVVDLNLTFAETGFEVMREVAAGMAGISNLSLDTKRESGDETSKEPEVNVADSASILAERERELRRSLEDQIRGLKGSLESIHNAAATSASSIDVLRAQASAVLKAFESRLAFIKTKASKTPQDDGTQKASNSNTTTTVP